MTPVIRLRSGRRSNERLVSLTVSGVVPRAKTRPLGDEFFISRCATMLSKA